MRELLHRLFWDTSFPALDPRPRLYVSNAVSALTVSGQVISRDPGEFAGEMDLEDAVDAESLVSKPIDCIYVWGQGVSGEWNGI